MDVTISKDTLKLFTSVFLLGVIFKLHYVTAGLNCMFPIHKQSRPCQQLFGSSGPCVTFYLYQNNNDSYNWFDIKVGCETHGGRFVHFREDFNESKLIEIIDARSAVTKKIRLGLVHTRTCKDTFYWAGRESETNCSEPSNVTCSTSNLGANCTELGCCQHGGQCVYPVHQLVANYTPEAGMKDVRNVDADDTTKHCMQLVKNSTSNAWQWELYNCSDPGDDETTYACEFNCPGKLPMESSVKVTWRPKDTCVTTTTTDSVTTAFVNMSTPSDVVSTESTIEEHVTTGTSTAYSGVKQLTSSSTVTGDTGTTQGDATSASESSDGTTIGLIVGISVSFVVVVVVVIAAFMYNKNRPAVSPKNTIAEDKMSRDGTISNKAAKVDVTTAEKEKGSVTTSQDTNPNTSVSVP